MEDFLAQILCKSTILQSPFSLIKKATTSLQGMYNTESIEQSFKYKWRLKSLYSIIESLKLVS
jgi:hypothetical protein